MRTLLELVKDPHQDDFTRLVTPAEGIRKAVKDLTKEGLELCNESEDRV